jgi:pimeloyl-ACP methyl ester carboxylesterase
MRSLLTAAAICFAGCAGEVDADAPIHTASAALSTPQSFTINVDGLPADGLVSRPSGAPRTMVVFAHGHGHGTASWVSHLEDAAAHGLLAVAMNYPATFDIDRGAAETIAAAKYFRAKHPTIERTILFGVSMGGAVSGTALAESRGIFDAWIDVEGIGNMTETWLAATAVGDSAAAEIASDCGGTPLTASSAYVRRSPALRGPAIAASGIKSAIVVHALADGLVPYNHGRETATVVAAAGVPVDFYTVARGACSETGTSLGVTFGLFDPLCSAGHATESSSTHVVMRTAFDALYRLADGTQTPVGYHEYFVDEPAP